MNAHDMSFAFKQRNALSMQKFEKRVQLQIAPVRGSAYPDLDGAISHKQASPPKI